MDRADLDRVKRDIRGLLVRDLQGICRNQGLVVSGVKIQLQKRIVECAEEYFNSNNDVGFRNIRSQVCGESSTASPSSTPYAHSSYSHASPAAYLKQAPAHSYRMTSSRPYQAPLPNAYPAVAKNLRFKNDAFNELVESKSMQVEMPPMAAHRHTVSTRLSLNEQLASDLQDPAKNMRILVYCGSDFSSDSPIVAFPSQCEVKVNGEMYNGNLRGLKKKAGTTHPADVTSLLRKRPPNYPNEVAVTYAGTDKRFAFIVYLARYTSPDRLVDFVKRRSRLSKETVLREMQREADDPDIVAGARIMSLSCPIGGGRIKTPVRSTTCNHNQCFDALNFFLAQAQAPQWECPVCNKTSVLERLAVDEYFEDILTKTQSTQAYNVTVQPNGKWEDKTPVKKVEDAKPKKTAVTISLDSDEDADEPGSSVVKPEPTSATVASFEPSLPEPPNGRKRKAEYIDLTLSDSDDDAAPEPSSEPPRPAPRVISSLPRRSVPSNGNSGESDFYSQLGELERRAIMDFNSRAPHSPLYPPQSTPTMSPQVDRYPEQRNNSGISSNGGNSNGTGNANTSWGTYPFWRGSDYSRPSFQ